MEVVELRSNGDHHLPDGEDIFRRVERTSVIIISNPDPATITFGIADGDGNFVAYADGAITEDTVINHGFGVDLMARVAGLVTTLTIGLSG